MIQVAKNELKPGMVLAKSVYLDTGELLLASGYVMDEKVMERLHQLDFPYFWIQEEGTETMVPQELIAEQIRLQSEEVLRDNAALVRKVAGVREATAEGMRGAVEDANRFKNIVMTDKVKKSVSDIVGALVVKDAVAVNLNSFRSKGGYLYQHALDVTITGIVLANKLHFNRFEMEELAIGCMLMDIGMMVIPDDICNKLSKLSFQEFAILKEHTTYGFTILRENKELPLSTADIAYQHHERQDGAGYPRRLRGNNDMPLKRLAGERGLMHRYAEIAAVADTYVALISPRPHISTPKSPEQAIRTLITAAGSQLNRSVVDALITLIPVYPAGTRIVIIKDEKYSMTGYSGIVARYRPDVPDKPSIMIMFNRRREKIKPILIDLIEESDIEIQFVVLS